MFLIFFGAPGTSPAQGYSQFPGSQRHQRDEREDGGAFDQLDHGGGSAFCGCSIAAAGGGAGGSGSGAGGAGGGGSGSGSSSSGGSSNGSRRRSRSRSEEQQQLKVAGCSLLLSLLVVAQSWWLCWWLVPYSTR